MRYMQTSRFEVPEFEIKRLGTYRPRISPDHMRRLWLLKQRSKKPITRLVEEALEDYLKKQKGGEKILTREEKLELLDRRLDEIRRGNAVIKRFERAVEKWLKKELGIKKAK